MTAQEIKEQLFAMADEAKRDFLPYFFKTGEGQYGYGDKFICGSTQATKTDKDMQTSAAQPRRDREVVGRRISRMSDDGAVFLDRIVQESW